MKARIENIFEVRPDIFWTRLFFDAEYNAGLYRELRFAHYEVLSLEQLDGGRIRRVLRAAPPLSGPESLRRILKERIYYDEAGLYDPQRGTWEFTNRTSVAAGSTHISGTIVAEPHPLGMKHVVELDVRVSAFGFGGIIERAIESNTRESYAINKAYTESFAAQRGWLAGQEDGAAGAGARSETADAS